MARQFIEPTVVNYLRKIAGEAYVMVQEIPMRSYLMIPGRNDLC